MGKDSAIAWTDATWNPWYGCQKVSQGCKHCYAERDMTAYQRDFRVVSRASFFDKPKSWKDPLRVFTCSWSDFFIDKADPWRDEAWGVIRATPHHQYVILTKRPERIEDHLPADWAIDPEAWRHVWLGVSAESQEMARVRLDILCRIPASVRVLSAEPLLGPVNLAPAWLYPTYAEEASDIVGPLGWIIVGGESGPQHRPMDMAWARALRDQAANAHIPFFFKQQPGERPGYNPYIIESDGTKSTWLQIPESTNRPPLIQQSLFG